MHRTPRPRSGFILTTTGAASVICDVGLHMTNPERNGRLFLRFMFALWIVAELILITASVAKHGAGEFMVGGIRLALTLGLMYG